MAAMKQRQERMETRVEALERDKARLEARVDELEHARVESAPMLAPEQDEPKPLLAFGYIEEIELLAPICSFLASKDLGRLVCVSASFGRKTDWQRSEEGGGTQQLQLWRRSRGGGWRRGQRRSRRGHQMGAGCSACM